MKEKKKKSITQDQDSKKIDELHSASDFDYDNFTELIAKKSYMGLYDFSDSNTITSLTADNRYTTRLYALDKLLERDKLREKDGFPRKIKLGKLIKPSKDGSDKTIIVPTTTEEKFYHISANPNGGGNTGGTGDESEGDVLGEEPLRQEDEDGDGAGQGKSGEHGMGAEAYDIGRILTEQFELPNVKDKGRKTSFTKFTYHLNDRKQGHGQLIDKKSTLKRVVKTNLALGRLNKDEEVDTSKFIITPNDCVYRTLSRERDYESQAIVFFLRDYSGSMKGKPTEVIVTQHIYIHSWLVYQYKRQVISRFILHDDRAIEVPNFYTYYNKQVAGGTDVASAYELVNKIVEEEGLARTHNVYIFHGTDGDDWDDQGGKALSELEIMLSYANRIGVTIAENYHSSHGNTTVERYLKNSKLLEKYPNLFHLDSLIAADTDEEKIIKSIKQLIS